MNVEIWYDTNTNSFRLLPVILYWKKISRNLFRLKMSFDFENSDKYNNTDLVQRDHL